MGMDIKAAVFVGLPRNEIESDDLQEWIDEEEIEVCPPHYDGYSADWAICGFELAGCGRYEPREFSWDQAAVDRLKAQFKELTGQDAKVWISPYVY